MIHKKRFVYPAVFAVLSCGALAVALHAENPDTAPPRPRHGPPPMPLFDALDTNHDGVISADEITNAPTALKTLLKNGATQITREDVRPPRPPETDDRAEHPRHRPPPPEAGPENDGEHPHPRMGDDEHRPHHRPPPPPDDEE